MSGIQSTFVRAIQIAVGLVFVSAPLAGARTNSVSPGAEPMTAQAASVPLLQPSTLVLVGVGLVGLAVYRSRFRDQK